MNSTPPAERPADSVDPKLLEILVCPLTKGPLEYDAAAWERRFLAQWPAGSDAHRSYHERIVYGPRYGISQALRRGNALAA